MSQRENAWTDRAARLAERLEADGALHDPAWKAAVAATPRHELVPTFYRQTPDNYEWEPVDATTPEGLDAAYSPTTLVTSLDGRDHPLSSSTKPDLIVTMLELLDIDEEHRVLAVGTGTGYTTALLTHRLGDRDVYSVDIDPPLVDAARDRLARLGHHPTLACRDGADGLPEHAPYDRIIATCSVPRVPWNWAEQLTPGGTVLVNVMPGAFNAGGLALLHQRGNRLEGRFSSQWASFMKMRGAGPTAPDEHRAPDTGSSRTRATTTPPAPWWDNRLVWLLAQFHGLPDGVTIGMRLDPDTGQPTAATMTAPDGSSADIALTATNGRYEVTETGPTPLWEPVEHAHRTWLTHGKPDWPRLGITATEHRQWLWIDHPHNPTHWPL
ncbi:protein-L-isoaspartate carboxylmethyltransferase [Actinopolyspora erythraea]|uniref:Protein-L-isoaspartate O-methyltransferase n=1 Tax=Actinopolyspora erythraea TaxID=414996 RepID=A0A099D8I8_9ACTN|nr:methyltransferase domain-containing protein [Actinopolyspora erythraea]ASU80190.1 protein-L-isoaspartate carboxylmethyltransferase [Actinopolyspora erythraea]KGI82443.1 protein-L-isoaspartate carboxylmethyltransferase [Actinopolyspora erythraea]